MASGAAGSTDCSGEAPPRLTLGERFGFPGNPRPLCWKKPDYRGDKRRRITDNGPLRCRSVAALDQRRATARADAALDTNGASAEDLQLSQEGRRERDRATERRAKQNGSAGTASAGAAWWDVASPSGQDIERATSLDAIRRARPLPTQHRPINRFDELTQLIDVDEPDVELKRAGTAGQRRLGALDPAQPAGICPVARANRDAAAQQHRRRH